jgi:uroporphyrinogen decarboxylase
MTSRERVLATLQHKEPDKVPIDFGGMRSTGIMAIAYNRLKKYLGLTKGDTRIYDVMQQLAEPEQEILDLFEVDVIDLNNSFGEHSENWRDWSLPDGSSGKLPKRIYPQRSHEEWFFELDNRRYRMPNGSLYFEFFQPILQDARSWREIDRVPWQYFTDEELKQLGQKAKYLYDSTDYAIMAGFGGNILEGGQELRGWGRFMLDLVDNRSFAEDLMDKLVEVYLKNLEVFLQAVGGCIQLIQMGDDLGTQEGPQISPDMYRELIKPRHKVIYQYVKNNSGTYVFLHSCGSIYKLIPDLIDEGIDVLNPVQTSAADMEPTRLKREFGDKITFWGGGCDTQSVLPRGSSEEVAAHVKDRMGILSPGGGFVFTQIHNIQADVPPENIVAMFEAVKESRNYPLTARSSSN